MPRNRLTGLWLLAACGSGRMPEARPLAGGGNEVEINRLMEEALAADGRGESADSLYAPYATVTADGKLRRRPPRFAGISGDGEIAITSTQLQSSAGAAWGDVEYRWVTARSNRVQVGRASLVVTAARGRPGWWIVQAHSSTVK
jgi:hypothetical protein